MQKQFTLIVNSGDVGRIVDALAIRAQAWRDTAAFLLTDDPPDNIMVEETEDPAEALAIANEYARIVSDIEVQTR